MNLKKIASCLSLSLFLLIFLFYLFCVFVRKTIRDHQIAHDRLNAGKEILAQAEARKIKAQQDVKQREEKLVVTEAKMRAKSQSAAEEIEEIEL